MCYICNVYCMWCDGLFKHTCLWHIILSSISSLFSFSCTSDAFITLIYLDMISWWSMRRIIVVRSTLLTCSSLLIVLEIETPSFMWTYVILVVWWCSMVIRHRPWCYFVQYDSELHELHNMVSIHVLYDYIMDTYGSVIWS